MKKRLLITSAYVRDELGESVVKSVLQPLLKDFDILLATHSPMGKEIQSMVKYYIYDHRNEMVVQDPHVHFWADYSTFYFRIHKDEGSSYHGYAVYRSFMNAIYLMKDYYDDFIFVEGDCLMSEKDIEKLKEFPLICERENKDALFFTYPAFLSTLIFYCKMKFFCDTFPFVKTVEEYDKCYKEIGSYGVLENFLFKCAERNNVLNRIHSIENVNIANYFDTSNLGMTASSFIDGDIQETAAYFTDVLKIENTNEVAFVYLCGNAGIVNKEMDVLLDGEKIHTIPAGYYINAIKINPNNDEFFVKIGSNRPKRYIKSKITRDNNPSFIRLK